MIGELSAAPAFTAEVLGISFNARGVVRTFAPDVFTRDTGWLRPLARAAGLNAHQLLSITRGKVWPRIGYAVAVRTPDPRALTLAWARLQRICLNTYPDAHTVCVVHDCGLLNQAVWFSISATISCLLDSRRDPYLAALLDYAARFRLPLAEHWERLLSVTGTTLAQIRGAPTKKAAMLLASGGYITWARAQIASEATRLGIYDASPRWEMPLFPCLYLRRRYCKYGFLFRLPHLGLPHTVANSCVFCGTPHADSGRHLMTECLQPPIPRPSHVEAVWPFDNSKSNGDLDRALAWARLIWKKRKELRLAQPFHNAAPRPGPLAPSTFFSVQRPEPPARRDPRRTRPRDERREPRRNTRRRVLVDGEPAGPLGIPAVTEASPSTLEIPAVGGMEPVSPISHQEVATFALERQGEGNGAQRDAAGAAGRAPQNRWTAAEDDRLVAEVVRGNTCLTDLAVLFPTRSKTQIRKRMLTKTLLGKVAATRATLSPN